ncbi:hypothetical protein ABZ629_28085, partial [Streptomyces sp. NPDC007110]
MLMRTDPFRELDRLAGQVLGTSGTWSRPAMMPMDAHREGDVYVIELESGPGCPAASSPCPSVSSRRHSGSDPHASHGA